MTEDHIKVKRNYNRFFLNRVLEIGWRCSESNKWIDMHILINSYKRWGNFPKIKLSHVLGFVLIYPQISIFSRLH